VAGRGTTATIALDRAKIPFTLHEYEHDPRSDSYGLEASEALGVPPERVFKTLPTMFCSAGRRGLEIEITPADLVKAAGARLAAIAAG
jgi:prolyl-tRNA editing enzyme YbaK/EbsC (Cys-tRNA(Pro) deacylase)